MKCVFFIFAIGILGQCAADISEEGIDVKDVVNADAETIKASLSHGLADYSHEQQNYQVEWFGCHNSGTRKSVLVLNADEAFDEGSVCSGNAIVQAFLNQEYNVIAVNRPGYGKTTPKLDDIGGVMTQKALNAAVEQASKQQGLELPDGVWGFGFGTIGASFFAKKSKGVHWLMLGNGIYDLEEFVDVTQDAKRKNQVLKVQKQLNEESFFEQRSVSWDTSGLPQKVLIYHGEKNQVSSKDHADSFRDTLASAQVNVIFDAIPEVGYVLADAKHRFIIETQLKKLRDLK